MLIVSDAQSRFSWSFQIAIDGSQKYGEPFYRLEIPESGWVSGVQSPICGFPGSGVYFASPVVLQVCLANGRATQILNPSRLGRISSIAFAGRTSTGFMRRKKADFFAVQ